MPFKKVNVEEEINQRIDADPNFKESYLRIDKEYDIIKSAIQMRKELGYSQQQIAKESGLKQQGVSRIEKVGNSPTLRNFIKYLDAAGLSMKIEKKSNKEDSHKYAVL